MNKSELVAIIREVVQAEMKSTMKRYVQAYVPIVVNEVVTDLVNKRLNESRVASKPVRKNSNGSGGMSLNEISHLVGEDVEDDTADWPQVVRKSNAVNSPRNWDRNSLAATMGYEDVDSMKLGGSDFSPPAPRRGGSSGPVVVDTIITDKGTPIQINPNSIPDDLTQAFNRNYSDLMEKLNSRTR